MYTQPDTHSIVHLVARTVVLASCEDLRQCKAERTACHGASQLLSSASVTHTRVSWRQENITGGWVDQELKLAQWSTYQVVQQKDCSSSCSNTCAVHHAETHSPMVPDCTTTALYAWSPLCNSLWIVCDGVHFPLLGDLQQQRMHQEFPLHCPIICRHTQHCARW